MLTPLQQSLDLIQKSQNILIALPESLNGDCLGSALALTSALKKLNKKAEIVCAESAPDKLRFLAGAGEIKKQLAPLRDFIISINTSQNKISRLRYEAADKVLKIFLTTPQKVEQKDINLEAGAYYYDLIITTDAPDLESLGQIFTANSEFFFNKPILNIDHKAGNEHFGEVNLVEATAASCSEIVADLIEKMGSLLIDAAIATSLLTGLIIKTNSWQNAKATPQALNLASLLIIKGADHETIIKNLYKTKPLNCLKLWGRLMGRLEFDETRKISWAVAAPNDFIATGTSAGDLPFALEEIQDIFPAINIGVILWADDHNETNVLMQSKRPELLQRINLELGGSIKNDRLLVNLPDMNPPQAKEKLNGLLNSLG